jgi:hypothetical protein
MKKAIWKKVKTFIVATMAIMGLVIAGSDGPYFPEANLAGLLLVCLIVAIASYREEMELMAAAEKSGARFEPALIYFLIHRISRGLKALGQRLIRRTA